ncbi:MAG: hypothetical protein IKU09_08945 [Firmicutes bacterium]|nr:hypothetical protein [Bacillota bacterium]
MIKKLKHRLRYHKLSRKQAALQNLCLTLLFAILFAVLTRGYMTDNSVEAAVQQWCEENFFGEAALWVSDERLKQLIYTLMDILPPPEK